MKKLTKAHASCDNFITALQNSASYALRKHSSNNDTLFLHLDDVSCYGNESKLSECRHRGVGITNCLSGTDEAGVICTGRKKYTFRIIVSLYVYPT